MRRVRLWIVFLLAIAVLFISISYSLSQPKHQRLLLSLYGLKQPDPISIESPAAMGNLVLITVDRLTLNDILNDDKLRQEVAKLGAMGIMNTGVEGSVNPASTFASIGAGAPLNASGSDKHGVNAESQLNGFSAAQIFHQRTGLATGADSVLQLDIARIKELNKDNRYSAVPGNLGTLLEQNNIDVRVIGNSDIIDQPNRPAVALGMNTQGIIPEGDVGDELTIKDVNFPGGLRTDYNDLANSLDNYLGKPGLTIVELGDLYRLERLGAYTTTDVLQSNRIESKARITNMIIGTVNKLDLSKDLLILVSPTPKGNYLPDSNYLTPVVAIGKGVTAGILTSPTTKRPGIIKNTDIAPAILNYFGIAIPTSMSGRSIQIIPTENTPTLLSSLYAKLELTNQARPPVLRYYVLIQLLLVLLSLAAIFLPQSYFLMTILKPLLLAVMSVPLALLLVALVPQTSILITVLEIISATVVIVSLLHLWLDKYANGLDPFIIISLLTSLCIFIDLLLGAPMQKNSLLGYDPIVGARFYGLGNEYMGVLIGSTIIGTTALINRIKKYKTMLLFPIGLYYMFTFYVIAAPQLGTNVGGSITAAFSFLVTILLLADTKFNYKTLLKITAAVGILLIALIAYDIRRPLENQSHIGRTATLIINGGAKEIIYVITRKLSMNIKLIKYSIWGRIFLASLASLAILFYRPTGVMQSLKFQYPVMYKGFIGVVTASFVALIFNDSGIVAAATTMIFGAPPLLYLVIRTLKTNC
ncbi:hypothetical protein SAMN05660649_00442 [Desulfotomaculum arcticum]|uniref:Uncharacterized protein n=1 Tax=Desulfotruncus arcticus DSM 17038 TaxID=1121424 RepID=A0A1I2NAI8_9FIRM|nr:hypothetical protein [Desulfotruncus arcticus]SFG00528.1 hypothetical protein SAMN05660649_00442 [Desulfotomaculum arcticum] [Desulfotruncus arcticus DSM 17038]